MANFNKVIIAGNLTRDPELRHTPKGTAVARIGVALNRKWKDDAGEQHEEVTFVDVDAFGRQAEVIGQYLQKGRGILVEGRLKLDTWEDKTTGAKRSQLRVMLESFNFVDSGSSEGGANSGSRPASRPVANQSNPNGGAEGGLPEDDDVPF